MANALMKIPEQSSISRKEQEMSNTKKKYHHYVLVLGDEGAMFVTKINYENKTASWEKTEAPLELGKYEAEDLARGLSLNFNPAFPVVVPYEIKHQPFHYDIGHFMWVTDKLPKPPKSLL